jgi:glycosyltransferase involved in cell wall biosynthesis
LVSVIIPAYNRYHTLKRAITSILNQTYKDIEIIIVDDGSDDETKKIQDEFDILYLRQKNRGVSSARNKGIKVSKGEWIAFLDSDDEWYKEKLQKQMEFFKNNPHIKVCHTGEKWIRDAKEVKYPKRLKKPSGWCFEDNLQTCKIAASSIIIKKEVFEKVGYFDEEKRVCEDYDMWLRISKEYKIGLLEEKLITKHYSNDGLSKSIKFIDLHHINSLLKFKEDAKVRQVIEKKSAILKKGAIKHGNQDILNQIKQITYNL